METVEKNAIKDLLIELGISTHETFVPYFPSVRDRDDVAVLKCTQSGVIILSRTDHMDITHYTDKKDFSYWGTADRKSALLAGMEDALRRFDQFKKIIANKKWLDIGTGAGGILDLVSPFALETAAVEPQSATRKHLSDLGYKLYAATDDAPNNTYDVVTLFHVLEHLTDPIKTLAEAKDKLVNGGKIIIEIPHAGDFLISFLEHEAFKTFTFWSEHLILHTRVSVKAFLEKAGFSNIVIQGFQRYPLANHLHWLSKNKPGGHNKWSYLRTEELDCAYSNMLASLDKTDTLIITAEK